MASHHLVAGDAIGDGVHNGPLRGGGLPAAVGFALWKFYDATATNIHVQFVILNKDAAPDDFAGFAHAFAGAAAEWKIHAGLALGRGAFVAVDIVCRRRAARDEEDPYVVVNAIFPIVFTPAQVVQGVFGWLPQSSPDAVGEQAVEARAFIDFVEMRECFAFVEDLTVGARFDRRAICVVENAFDQIRCRAQVFEALLILNANGGATKIIGNAYGGNVHFALHSDLVVGEFVGGVCAGDKGEALALEPGANSTGFCICGVLHFCP